MPVLFSGENLIWVTIVLQDLDYVKAADLDGKLGLNVLDNRKFIDMLSSSKVTPNPVHVMVL